jgi:hypothetical protein
MQTAWMLTKHSLGMRYFLLLLHMKVKWLDLKSLKRELSEMLSNILVLMTQEKLEHRF